MSYLTEHQQQLVNLASEFTINTLFPLEQQLEEQHEISSETSQRLTRLGREAGLFATNIAAQYGGQGMSVFENVLVQEQLGQSKDVLVRRATGNVYECLAVGTDEQIEQYLLPSVSGERSCSLAISEPEAGSDIASIATTAIQTDNGWILNGRKCYISDAEFSDYFIVAAKTAPELDEKGISLFLVDKQSAGFSLGENFNMMGFIGTSHNELIFDNIELSPSALLGDENKGFFLLCNTLGSARLAKVAGRCLGKCVRLLKLMTEHINQRHQFGQSLAKVGVIQQMLADSTIEISAARALLWQTAKAIDEGAPCIEEISMLKVLTTETFGKISDRAVQVFGAKGCHQGLVIESFYRDARLFRIIDGTSEIHRNIIFKSLNKNRSFLFDVVE